jgi:hypothetical protein
MESTARTRGASSLEFALVGIPILFVLISSFEMYHTLAYAIKEGSRYPPQSPTRITKDSILKLAGAFHGLKTSRIRFCAFSYSMGEPCGRSFQVIMYFMNFLLYRIL